MLNRSEIEVLNRFDHPTRLHVNCIRFDFKSGVAHRKKVLALCEEAMENGHNFITRARLDSPTHKD